MGVSKKRGGPPKSWNLIGFSIINLINHPFWGFYHYFWKHPYVWCTKMIQHYDSVEYGPHILNRGYIFKWLFFHCHVSFRGNYEWKLFSGTHFPLNWLLARARYPSPAKASFSAGFTTPKSRGCDCHVANMGGGLNITPYRALNNGRFNLFPICKRDIHLNPARCGPTIQLHLEI